MIHILLKNGESCSILCSQDHEIESYIKLGSKQQKHVKSYQGFFIKLLNIGHISLHYGCCTELSLGQQYVTLTRETSTHALAAVEISLTLQLVTYLSFTTLTFDPMLKNSSLIQPNSLLLTTSCKKLLYSSLIRPHAKAFVCQKSFSPHKIFPFYYN